VLALQHMTVVSSGNAPETLGPGLSWKLLLPDLNRTARTLGLVVLKSVVVSQKSLLRSNPHQRPYPRMALPPLQARCIPHSRHM
jgi:hypothetical protein